MESRRRDQIQISLRSLAASHRATMELMEQTFLLLCEELALDSLTNSQLQSLHSGTQIGPQGFTVDRGLLSVSYQGRVCFLGNTLPFRFISHLARRLNSYVAHEDLLTEVWQGAVVSDEAVRSVVKTLRHRLRRAGLVSLADAIDGKVSGHYALKLPH